MNTFSSSSNHMYMSEAAQNKPSIPVVTLNYPAFHLNLFLGEALRKSLQNYQVFKSQTTQNAAFQQAVDLVMQQPQQKNAFREEFIECLNIQQGQKENNGCKLSQDHLLVQERDTSHPIKQQSKQSIKKQIIQQRSTLNRIKKEEQYSVPLPAVNLIQSADLPKKGFTTDQISIKREQLLTRIVDDWNAKPCKDLRAKRQLRMLNN